MARRALLSEAWWQQATIIPDNEREIAKHYTLDRSDLDLIMRQNKAANRLGLACVLATLRYPGRPLADGEVLPAGVLRFLARQIGAKSVEPCKPEVANRHSGYLVDFPMEQERVASVILHDAQGQVLPVGSLVSRAARSNAVVGYDGIAWLDNLSEINPMTVLLPDGHRCTALLTLPEARSHQLQTWGPVTCKVGS